MRITHTPPSDSWLAVLEEVHPEPIRWDVESKKYCINRNELCFWVVGSENDNLYLGEFLIDKKHETPHVHLISISSLKKGVGNFMWGYLIELLTLNKVDTALGEARPGASWHLAQKHGAKKLGDRVNHGGTGETYIDFIIELNK